MSRYAAIAKRIATRPIHLDRAAAQKSVRRFMAFMQASSYWGDHPAEPLGEGVLHKGSVTIQDVTGNSVEVEVQYRVRKSSSSDMVLGGGSGKTNGTNRPAIVLILNGIYSLNDLLNTNWFENDLTDMLMHELTHQADIYTKSVMPVTQRVHSEEEIDTQRYYNSPAEIHAYMREVFEELRHNLSSMLSKFSVSKIFDQRWLRDLSPTWANIEQYLTEQSKKIILKGVYQAVQDYISVEGLQRAAAERIAATHDVREIVKPYENLPLECDGMTRVVTYLLKRAGIRHRVMLGTISVEGKGEFAPHYWVELQSGEVVDYRNRMWFGNDRGIPQGVFKPAGTIVSYSGRPISLPVNDVLFSILTM